MTNRDSGGPAARSPWGFPVPPPRSGRPLASRRRPSITLAASHRRADPPARPCAPSSPTPTASSAGPSPSPWRRSPWRCSGRCGRGSARKIPFLFFLPAIVVAASRAAAPRACSSPPSASPAPWLWLLPPGPPGGWSGSVDDLSLLIYALARRAAGHAGRARAPDERARVRRGAAPGAGRRGHRHRHLRPRPGHAHASTCRRRWRCCAASTRTTAPCRWTT